MRDEWPFVRQKHQDLASDFHGEIEKMGVKVANLKREISRTYNLSVSSKVIDGITEG